MLRSEVILSVNIIAFVIGLPANLLALYAFSVKIHIKAHPADILLLNLTISDLLFLIVLPLKMHKAVLGMKWDMPDFLCSLFRHTFSFIIYTSSLLLMAVSVVRYIAVVFPVTYHRLQKPVYAVVASAVIWLIALAHCSVVSITMNHLSLTNNTGGHGCFRNFTERQLEVLLPIRLEIFVVLFLVPLLICVYCYLKCIYILYNKPRISRMQKQKAIGMALGSLVVFLICMLPFHLSHLVGFIQGKSSEWRHYVLLLSTFNTCLDPIIYYFSSSTFRCNSKRSIFRKGTLNALKLERQDSNSSQG